MVLSLVIGYGSELRGDDAVGQQIAQLIESWQLTDLRSLAVHQLTPELAEEIAQVDLAIFVDACPMIASLQRQPLEPQTSGTLDAHTGDPRSLLALAEILYGRAPESWWLLIPAEDFTLGADLSTLTQQSIPEALQEIQNLIYHRDRTSPSEDKHLCTKSI